MAVIPLHDSLKQRLQHFCDLSLGEFDDLQWDLYRVNQKNILSLKVRATLYPDSLAINEATGQVKQEFVKIALNFITALYVCMCVLTFRNLFSLSAYRRAHDTGRASQERCNLQRGINIKALLPNSKDSPDVCLCRDILKSWWTRFGPSASTCWTAVSGCR